MNNPNSGLFSIGPLGGVVYQYTNDTGASMQPESACISAPLMTAVDVFVDGNTIDRVYVQSSHTWWTMAGNRMLRYPLQPGQTLCVKANGECAFRIDWYN